MAAICRAFMHKKPTNIGLFSSNLGSFRSASSSQTPLKKDNQKYTEPPTGPIDQEYIDDAQLGDYPRIHRSFYKDRYPYGWWDLQNRRNYGETLHKDADILQIHGADPHNHIKLSTAAKGFGASVIVLLSFIIGSAWFATTRERTFVLSMYPRDGLIWEVGGPGTRALKPIQDIVLSE